jgi:hypothetical protein
MLKANTAAIAAGTNAIAFIDVILALPPRRRITSLARKVFCGARNCIFYRPEWLNRHRRRYRAEKQGKTANPRHEGRG